MRVTLFLILLGALLLSGCGFYDAWTPQAGRARPPSTDYNLVLDPSSPTYFQDLDRQIQMKELEDRVWRLEHPERRPGDW